ncbi:hypothetical protein CSB37_03810 [bacterium DOLZORAL124_38_8]|nr:MAG: hypothetical protein CSB37_03810 [bacterium DOLZORAL124_38_8]
MKKRLQTLRYVLEFMAFPMFFFLITHLVGHGILLLFEVHHQHGFQSYGTQIGWQELFENLFTFETLLGFIGAVVIMIIWQKTKLKKFVPCNHEYCSIQTQWWHLGAIVALCFHFFPEAFLRKELLANEHTHLFAQIGFFCHLIIDILVAGSISWAFSKTWQKISSFIVIATTWFAALYLAHSFNHFEVNPLVDAFIHLGSGFILGMFLHIPHKPKTCSCTHTK